MEENIELKIKELKRINMHIPDNWVILKLKDCYKVLCGTSGGYLDGDSWKLNSGITKIEEDDKAYYIHGFSGSVYKCYKGSETLRFNCAHIYYSLRKLDPTITIVPIDTISEEFKEENDALSYTK